MRFAHAMINVRDLAGAVAFYERALGCSVSDRHEYEDADLVYLRLPGSAVELELIAPRIWTFQARPEAGRCHLAFTVEDLVSEHASLRRLGISVGPILDYVANGRLQTRYFYFDDPEGNQIEMLEAIGRYALTTR